MPLNYNEKLSQFSSLLRKIKKKPQKSSVSLYLDCFMYRIILVFNNVEITKYLGLFDLSVFHPVSAIDQSYYSGDSLGKENIPVKVI